MTGPLVPVGMLNLIRGVLGIHHHRFNLSVKRSRIAVNAEPVTASHTSGAAARRCPSAERSAIMARMTAVAATITSHENVRTLGGRSRRTGVRSAERSRIRSSCAESAFEGAFMALFPEFHFNAKGLQRAMQIDFERAPGAPGQRGGVGKRALLEYEKLHCFALARRQGGERAGDGAGRVGLSEPP